MMFGRCLRDDCEMFGRLGDDCGMIMRCLGDD